MYNSDDRPRCAARIFGAFLAISVAASTAHVEAASTEPVASDAIPQVGYYGYGRVPTQAEIDGWAIAVRPDGQGLPTGEGSVSQGADIFVQHCAMCHGTLSR